jgi:hypothetical protein
MFPDFGSQNDAEAPIVEAVDVWRFVVADTATDAACLVKDDLHDCTAVDGLGAGRQLARGSRRRGGTVIEWEPLLDFLMTTGLSGEARSTGT